MTEQSLPGNSNTQVYVVTNGVGGEVDSAWTNRDGATLRATALNQGASFTLAWSVVEVNLIEGIEV